jgi:thioredoxin reductase
MPNSTKIAIIGAGPYGLSIAAHLRARGLPFRIFGIPMHTWSAQMPKDMLLKSEGFATNLGDPAGEFTLKRFCRDHALDYADENLPIPRETVARYGLAFQRQLVPQVEQQRVVALEPTADGFALKLSDGETVSTRAVVVAVGISDFRSVPDSLMHFPREYVSHSADLHELSPFRGRDLAIIGGGASAIDLAALLHEAGANVQLVIRGASLNIHTRRQLPRPMLDVVRAPMSTIGPGWRALFCAELPRIFHYLPRDLRLRIVRGGIPPAAGWFMRDRVDGKVPVLLGYSVTRAELKQGRVQLRLVSRGGHESQLSTEYVIAATGYKCDLYRLPFMSVMLLNKLRSVHNTPILSSDFQSSVPGLYFVGELSANSFGPVVRFIAGTIFTARRLSRHLTASYTSRFLRVPRSAPEQIS